MYIVSISLIFCTLFAKDASIQMGISLLPVLQLTKFVADLDYTVCQTSIKMITEKYNTAMYMMTWRWQFMKITVRWIFFRSHECFMMVYDGYMIVSWYFMMVSWWLRDGFLMTLTYFRSRRWFPTPLPPSSWSEPPAPSPCSSSAAQSFRQKVKKIFSNIFKYFAHPLLLNSSLKRWKNIFKVKSF